MTDKKEIFEGFKALDTTGFNVVVVQSTTTHKGKGILILHPEDYLIFSNNNKKSV